MNGAAREDVIAAKKFHLRRPAGQENFKSVVIGRPEENDRGGITGLNHSNNLKSKSRPKRNKQKSKPKFETISNEQNRNPNTPLSYSAYQFINERYRLSFVSGSCFGVEITSFARLIRISISGFRISPDEVSQYRAVIFCRCLATAFPISRFLSHTARRSSRLRHSSA